MTYNLYTIQINVCFHTHKYYDINLDINNEIDINTYKYFI